MTNMKIYIGVVTVFYAIESVGHFIIAQKKIEGTYEPDSISMRGVSIVSCLIMFAWGLTLFLNN